MSITLRETVYTTTFFYVVYRCLIFLLYKSPFRELSGPKPASWAMGNLGQLFNAKGLPFHRSLRELYGGMVRVYGFFGDEQLYISDPSALYTIMTKEQDAFEETAVFTETNRIIFGPGLVSTTGAQHARQRRVVNPIFAVPHLRRLSPVFYEIADKLADVIAAEIDSKCNREESSDSQFESPRAVVDMSEWMCRVALESVGRTVLGYSFDPLDSPHNNPYTSAIKELIPTLFSLSLVRQFAPFLAKLGPPSFRRKTVELIPHGAVQKVKNMSDVMHDTAVDILRQKREEIAKEDGVDVTKAKDIISILSNEEAKANGGEELSDAELTGQMTVLIFGAQDTTSSCLSRVLHQLSVHRRVQDDLRKEILEAMRNTATFAEHNGHLDYDTLSRLPVLDAVLKETLRLYPPIPFVRRSAVRDIVLPYSRAPDGISDMASVRVPSGTIVFVDIAGSNSLTSVWGEDAGEWKPERWLEGNSGVKNSGLRLPGVYSGMMSFLAGERSCVGYKFALLEMKIILATLISRFTFSATDDEIVWNLAQIISPSMCVTSEEGMTTEKKGLPLIVEII
ncbi:cytochrome P450 [Pholiota conissans]|uniref:Cytochrome P450 n=1 Tax=Pholiota conissans TaxID=109636 RepID=A0A9P6D3Y7_9AGAR|nr:cytochrome P450 [Pholiota conissans]